MPETDGGELGRLIGKRHPDLPVLYMSAYPAHDVLHRGAPGPGQPFLRKPFTSETLIAAVQSLLEVGRI
jgi:CheY-like chemotaxis protein